MLACECCPAAARKVLGAGLVGCSSVASSVAATRISRLRRPISGWGYVGGTTPPGARGLRQDGLVTRAAAPAHGAATAMEHAQLDAVAGGQLVEQLHQRNLG